MVKSACQTFSRLLERKAGKRVLRFSSMKILNRGRPISLSPVIFGLDPKIYLITLQVFKDFRIKSGNDILYLLDSPLLLVLRMDAPSMALLCMTEILLRKGVLRKGVQVIA